MLTIHDLEQALYSLGFARLLEPRCFAAGSLIVELLDAPRLRIHTPTGLYFLAASSASQLANALAELPQAPSLASSAATRWYLA